MRNQQGFTLIELVVVIVVLGILAAIAVPRFIDLQTDARTATVRGMEGAVRGATSLAHARALIDGATGATGTITMEGQAVDVVYGYPAGATGGIDTALNLSGFTPTFVAGPPAVTTFGKDGAPTPANCSVQYTEAANATTPPVVVIDLTGC